MLTEHALDDTVLSHIFTHNEPGVVQFFYQIKDRQATIYVLDEYGALFTDTVSFFKEASLLDHFEQFFESVEFRQRSSVLTDTRGHGLPQVPTMTAAVQEGDGFNAFPPLRFYQITSEKHEYRFTPRSSKSQRRTGGFFDVKVVGQLIDGKTEFIVYVNEQEFSIREYGKQLFEKLTQHILARRVGGEPYPIYITDIDLSWLASAKEADTPFHTIHYLQYKRRIEHKLNEQVRKMAEAHAA